MAKALAMLAAVGFLAAATVAYNPSGANEFRRVYQRRQAELFNMFSSMPFPLPLPMGGNGGSCRTGGVTINVGGGGGCCNCGCPPPPPPPPGPAPAPAPWSPEPQTWATEDYTWASQPSSSWASVDSSTTVNSVSSVIPEMSTDATTPVICTQDNDLVLVIDESGSVGQHNFDLVVDFASRWAEAWRTHPGNRVAAIFFASHARTWISLKDSETLDGPAIKQKMLQVTYKRGGTDIGTAVNMTTSELIANGRAGVPKNVVVLTDGVSYNPQGTHEAIDHLNISVPGVRTFGVGIGQGTDDSELLVLAGNQQSNLFHVDDFQQLENTLRSMSSAVCQP